MVISNYLSVFNLGNFQFRYQINVNQLPLLTNQLLTWHLVSVICCQGCSFLMAHVTWQVIFWCSLLEMEKTLSL